MCVCAKSHALSIGQIMNRVEGWACSMCGLAEELSGGSPLVKAAIKFSSELNKDHAFTGLVTACIVHLLCWSRGEPLGNPTARGKDTLRKFGSLGSQSLWEGISRTPRLVMDGRKVPGELLVLSLSAVFGGTPGCVGALQLPRSPRISKSASGFPSGCSQSCGRSQ